MFVGSNVCGVEVAYATAPWGGKETGYFTCPMLMLDGTGGARLQHRPIWSSQVLTEIPREQAAIHAIIGALLGFFFLCGGD